MPINPKVKQIYDTLKDGGADVGSEKEFNDYFFAKGKDGYNNRKEVFNTLREGGADAGKSYEEFSGWLGLHAVKPKPATPQHTVQATKPAPARPVRTQPTRQQKSKDRPMTAAEKASMISNVGDIVRSTQAGLQRTRNMMTYAKSKAGLHAEPVKLGQKSNVVETAKQYNPKTGKMQPHYLTEAGNEYDDKAQADMEQAAIDEQKRRELDPVQSQLEDAYGERDRLEEAIRKRRKELEDEYNSRPWYQRMLTEMGKAAHSDMDPAATATDPEHMGFEQDEQYMQLMSAIRKNHQTIQTLEDKKNGKMNSFWHSLGTTLTNGYTFADGLPEMRDATAILNAQKHIDSINRKRQTGQALTKEEEAAEAVLRNTMTDNAVQGTYGSEYGAWGRAGSGMAQSIDFMKDFLLLPGAGSIAKGVAGKVAGIGGKYLAKKAGETAVKATAKAIARATLKATGVVAGAHAAGAVISNTTGIGRTAAKMGQLSAGDVSMDKNGNYKIENQQDLMSAFAEAEREQARENGSEMFGEFIPGGKVLSAAGKKALSKIGLGKISDMLTSIGNKAWYKNYTNLLSKGGYNGIPGEALEEYEGMFFDAITGHADEAVQDFTDPKQQVDIWLGCATMGALMGAVPMGLHIQGYYRYKHSMDRADKTADFRLTPDRWQPLKEQIDQTDNGNMSGFVVDNILNNKKLEPQEKEAAMDYVRNLTKFRGFNIAQVNNADETARETQAESIEPQNEEEAVEQQQNEESRRQDEERQQAYETGREAADMADTEGDRSDADAVVLRLREAYDEIERVFADDAEMRLAQLEDDPWEVMDDQSLTPEQQDAVAYFVNSKAAMEGLNDAANEKGDNKHDEAARQIEQRTNKQSGMIHPATLKVDDRQVYIVSGNVAMFPDGSAVDIHHSSESVVVCDAETGEMKFISPEQIYKVDEPMDPDIELQAADEAIRAEQQVVLGNDTEEVPEQAEEVANDGVASDVQNENEVNLPQSGNIPQNSIESEVNLSQNETDVQEPSALNRIPKGDNGEPLLEQADPETAWDGVVEYMEDADDAQEYVESMVAQLTKDVDNAKKAVSKVKPSADMAKFKADKAAARQVQADAEARLDKWVQISNVNKTRKQAERNRINAERAEADRIAREKAVAELAEQKRVEAEKKAEQEAIGAHAVNPKIKEKWDAAPKVVGNADIITLPDGSKLRGHYVLTEAGAATASHDVNNAYKPTEGFPIDENGQSVNDRDYERDEDARKISRSIADNYDSRALQSVTVVDNNGITLSGNGRNIAGELAAQQGTDGAYIDYLREFPQKYGLTAEQVQSMQHPRVHFVPDEVLPYDAATFARFNAQEMKSQSKPEAAVKLGKVVPDNTFGNIVRSLAQYDRLSDFYANEKDANGAIMELVKAGVVNDKQLPELRTGEALSAAGHELLENTLIGKVFQSNPDAVRQIIAQPGIKQSIVMALSEIAHNRTLANGYDLSEELSNAVDLVARAKQADPDTYKEGMPVSPFGRQQELFDDELGDKRVTEATTLLLADILNSTKPSDLRKVLATYNAEGETAANGQLDIFSGDLRSKEEILKDINQHFINATPKEQQALVDAAIEERKRRAAEAAASEQSGGNGTTEQTAPVETGSGQPQPVEGTPIGATSAPDEVQAQREQTETNPTEAQKEAGNYRKGHIKVDGFDIALENPKGSTRSGKDANGKEWSITMKHDYGYIRGTKGTDGDHIDVYLSENPTAGNVYVVDQINQQTGAFDEHKVMYGFGSMKEAVQAYRDQYEDGWKVGKVTEVSREEFKKWVDSSTRKTKPFAEYKGVKSIDTERTQSDENYAHNSEEIMHEDVKPAESSEKYTITPTQYTNKKGKTSDMYLVKFNNELSKEEKAAAKAFVGEPLAEGRRTPRGWYDREQRGYMVRSEEAARQLGDMMADEVAVADEQPLTVQDYRNAVAPATHKEQEKKPSNAVSVEDAAIQDVEAVVHSPEHKDSGLDFNGDVSKEDFNDALKDLHSLLGVSDDEEAKYAQKALDELKEYQRKTDTTGRTSVDEKGFDPEDLFVPLLLDGKPSRAGVLMSIPDRITDPSGQVAVYDFSNDDEGNADWQKWDDLAEEYNKNVSREEKAYNNGDVPILRFKGVDAAVKFVDWLNSTRNKKPFVEYSSVKTDGDVKAERPVGDQQLQKAIDAYEKAQEQFAKLYARESKMGDMSRSYDSGEWAEVNRTRIALQTVLLQLSTAELRALSLRNLDKATKEQIEKVQETAQKEEQRSIAFNAALDRQGSITPVYEKSLKPIAVTEFILTDHKEAETRPVLTGVYHDKGNVVGTNGKILLARKEDYDKSLEGKITDKKGNVIGGIYPNWRGVVSGSEQAKSWNIDLNELHAFTRGVFAKLKADGAKRNMIRDAKIAFRTADGKIILCNANTLDKAIQGAESIGATKFGNIDINFAMAHTPKGYVICPMLDNYKIIDDNTFVYIPRQAELQYSKEALANDTQAKRKVTEAVLTALSKTGIGVVQATDEQDKPSANDDTRYRDFDEEVNEQFNRELAELTEENADTKIFNLGNPSSILLSAGVEDKPMKLYGNKVIKKMKKHGFALAELRDLPKAVANPIAVFDNIGRIGNRSILTELGTQKGNFLVTIDLGKGGEDIDFNIVSSVFGKDGGNVVDWIERSLATYINKEKALRYLHHPALSAEALSSSRLSSAAKIVKDFVNPSIGEEKKSLQGKMDPQDTTPQAKALQAKVLSEKLNTPIRVVSDPEEIAELPSRRQQRAKGWWSAKNEEVVILLPNNADAADVTNTVVHEVVGHKGLRKLIGEERFDEFLGEVYGHASKPIRAAIDQAERKLFDAEVDRLTQQKNAEADRPGSRKGIFSRAEATVEANRKREQMRREATEEYMADMAGRIGDEGFEKMSAEELTFWGKVKARVQQFLDKFLRGLKIAKGVRLTDKDVAYILYKSWKNLRNGGKPTIMDAAEDALMRSKTHYDEIPENDVMFRDGDSVEYRKAQARNLYEQRVSRGLYQMQEAIQDSMLGLKEAMEAVLKAEGGYTGRIEDVAGYENPYLGENRLSSVNQAECAAFAQTLFKPMLEEVAKLAKTAKERAELTDYMMAKHGLERNDVMARRAAEKVAHDEFRKELKAAEHTVANDPLDQDAADVLADVKQRMQDRENELYAENRSRDYAGLTALTGKDDVADAESEAEQMVSGYEADHDTTDLWGKVNAVTKATLQKTYECGIISKATYDDISDMYEHYIPLRGFDEKTSDEAYAYLSDKHSAFNAPIKTAKGRKSKADDPFANMEAMAESAIMQGNRNMLVKRKFMRFAQNHPSDLVSISDLWLRYDDVTDEWKPVNAGDVKGTERIEEDDTPREVERKMRDFEEKMRQLSESDPDHFKKQKDHPDIPYRVVGDRDLRQHQVLVKQGGKDYVLTINGNPRAAQALNGQTNPDNDASGAMGAILHYGEVINRQLSAFYTTRNPDFVVSNFMRDMLYANTMVWAKESPNYALRFHKNFAKVNPAKMKMLFARLRKGTLDVNNETEKAFSLFMANGGETGYSNIRDIEQRKNDIRRELKKYNGKLPVRKALTLLGERFDEYNGAVENCARFAAFMTSRQMKRSIDRSVYDAKEISVNFNKKGSGAKFMNKTGQTPLGNAAALVSGLGRSGFVFWNAAIQGTTNFGRQFKRHPGKALAGAAAMFLLGALVAGIAGDDGNDGSRNSYYNLPEYVRRSNIMFRMPGMEEMWVSIPLPVEYRALYGMGELMMSTISGKEHYTSGELAGQIAGQVSQALPIDFMEGGGGFKAFVPSAVKPFAEVMTNKSWTGMPLYKDTPWNKDMPEWTKAYKSANKQLVGLSKVLNEVSGGDAYTSGVIDINPAQVEYLLNGYFGGVSSTIDKFAKMGETALGQREYDPRSFLILNRLVKSGDERTEYRHINNEYFRLKEEHDKLKARLKHYEEDTYNGVFDYAEKINWLNKSPEYQRLEIFEDYSSDINAINKELKEPMNDNERKELEKELYGLKKKLVDEANKTRK